MAPRRLLLAVAVAAASSLPAAASPAAHETAETPSRELLAADPAAAAAPRTVHNDDDAHHGACGGLLVIPPHMIRAAGPRGVYDVTIVLRATRHRGQYYVGPGFPGSVVAGDDDGGGHREEFVPMLMTGLVFCGLSIIFLVCLEMLTGLRGDGDDEAYSGGEGAFPMKSVLVDLAHADAVKVKQPRGDN